MKTLVISCILMIPLVVSSQYLELFNLADRGLISSPGTFNYSGIDWTIEVGSIPNPGGIAASDYFKTAGGALVARDSDVEFCFYTPVLDISVPSNSSLSIPFDAPLFDSPSNPPVNGNDYIQVDYSTNGGSSWNSIGNQFGGGSRTVELPIGAPGEVSFNGTIVASGITGSSLQIRICVLNTNSMENISIFSVNVPEAGTTVLPVKWGSVSVNKSADGNAVKWTTYNEINNESFEVERSLDGGENFTVVGTLNGAGNSSQLNEYNFVDNHDFPSTSIVYYRVKQTDFDGKYDYSPIVAIRNDNNTTYEITPNPFHDFLTFTGSNQDQENEIIDIINLQGTNVKQFKNINGTIDTSDLLPGIYFIKLPSGEMAKVVKL